MSRESLELHGIEMERAFMFGMKPTKYEAAVERIQSGGTDAEDVATVLRGETENVFRYKEGLLQLFSDPKAPLTAMLGKLKALEPSEP